LVDLFGLDGIWIITSQLCHQGAKFFLKFITKLSKKNGPELPEQGDSFIRRKAAKSQHDIENLFVAFLHLKLQKCQPPSFTTKIRGTSPVPTN
jgi:hypothetical protein